MAGGMIRKFRILILLYVLLMVALSTWLAKERSTDWDKPLDIVIYPINGDGSEVTTKYIDSLEQDTFVDIEEFFVREANRYQLTIKKPVDIDLSREIKELPPVPPGNNASVISIMFWSLKLRYWSWRVDNYKYSKDIQMFIIYFDPEKISDLLIHWVYRKV